MKVWRLRADLNYCYLYIPNENESNRFMEYEFCDKIENWDPVKVKPMRDGIMGDHPSFTPGAAVFSSRAVDVLLKDHHEKIQLFPILPKRYRLSLINVTHLVDCVDYERSKGKDFRGDRIIAFSKIVFKEDLVDHQYLFKIPELSSTHIFVTDEFRDRVLESGLEGFQFELVWDSEELPMSEEQKEQAYYAVLERIEREKGTEVSFEEAYSFVQNGYLVQSGEFRMNLNEQKQLIIGTLNRDCEYTWLQMDYYPPAFLARGWHLTH